MLPLTPIDIVLQNCTGMSNIPTDIFNISYKWNRRWPHIQNQWPIHGSLDIEIIKDIQVLIKAYRAEEKSGKRKEKRQKELGIIELFLKQSQRMSQDAEDKTVTEDEKVPLTAPMSPVHHSSHPNNDFLPVKDYDSILVSAKTGLETLNYRSEEEYRCHRDQFKEAEDNHMSSTESEMDRDRLDVNPQNGLLETLISVGKQLEKLTTIFNETLHQLSLGAFQRKGRAEETCKAGHHEHSRRVCQVDWSNQMDLGERWRKAGGDTEGSRGVSLPCNSAEKMSQSPVTQAPVIINEQSLPYKPWANNMDVIDIESKLPLLQEGGAPWIARLEEIMPDAQMTIGDFKILLSRLVGGHDLADILTRAGLAQYIDSSEGDTDFYFEHRGLLRRALREQYPTNVHPDDILIEPLGQTENPRAYVKRAYKEWQAVTWNNPDRNQMEGYLLRKKIQKGLPQSALLHLESVVALQSMSNEMYFDHIENAVNLSRAEEESQMKDDMSTTRRLNDLRLYELEVQAAERKMEMLENAVNSQPWPWPGVVDQQATQPVTISQAVNQQAYNQGVNVSSYQPFNYQRRRRTPDDNLQVSQSSFQQHKPAAVKLKSPCHNCGERTHFYRQCNKEIQMDNSCPPWRRGSRRREMMITRQADDHPEMGMFSHQEENWREVDYGGDDASQMDSCQGDLA